MSSRERIFCSLLSYLLLCLLLALPADHINRKRRETYANRSADSGTKLAHRMAKIPPDDVQVFLCQEVAKKKAMEGVENVQSFHPLGALLYKVLTLYPSFSGHKKDIIKSLEK